MTSRNKLLIFFSGGALFIFLCLTFIFSWQLPRLHHLRETIDADRASILAEQQQQANLQSLKRVATEISATKEALDKELWFFEDEDDFYEAITNIAATSGIKAAEPEVSIAVPGDQVIVREATLTFTGKIKGLLSGLAAIQKHQPLLAVESVSFNGEDLTTMTVKLRMVWQ